jgi:hypothetical protein
MARLAIFMHSIIKNQICRMLCFDPIDGGFEVISYLLLYPTSAFMGNVFKLW